MQAIIRILSALLRRISSFSAVIVVALISIAVPSGSAAAPYAYVAHGHSSFVSVIDTATQSLVTNIPMPGWQYAMAMSPSGKYVYVTDYPGDGGNVNATVRVIDTSTQTVIREVTLCFPVTGMAVTPDGRYIYLTTFAKVYVLSAASLQILYSYDNVPYPQSVAISPDGRTAYFVSYCTYDERASGTCGYTSSIWAYDTSSRALKGTVQTGRPYGIQTGGLSLTPNGNLLYAADGGFGPPTANALVVDTSNLSVISTFAGAFDAVQTAVSLDGKFAYVTRNAYNGVGGSVQIIDTATQQIVQTIAVTEGAAGIAFTPDGQFAYISQGSYYTSGGKVVVLDTATRSIVGNPILIGSYPTGIVIQPSTSATGTAADQPSSVTEGTLFTLEGPGGGPCQNLAYSWTQIGGPSVSLSDPTRQDPTFVAPYLPSGLGSQTLTFQLTVTGGNTTTTSLVNVVIVKLNHAPVADAGVNQNVYEGSAVTLSGVNSYDPDGDTITYSWTQISGPQVTMSASNGSTTSFTAPALGSSSGTTTLIFALTVSDGSLSNAAPVTVKVERRNHPPVANTGSGSTVRPGTTVTLNGALSSDPDGDPLQFSWTQVSGPGVTLSAAATSSPSFIAPPVATADTLVFRLVVSDGLASSAPSNVSITVTNNRPVCTAASGSPTILWPPNHAMVPVTITGVSDPDNDRLTLTIDSVLQDEPVNSTGDGDTAPDAAIQPGGKVLLRSERAGSGDGRIYFISFSASDSLGGSCTGTVRVAVPKSMKPNDAARDSAARYDSTAR